MMECDDVMRRDVMGRDATHYARHTNAGNCNLDPMVGRAIRDHPADAINLKLGINMMAR